MFVSTELGHCLPFLRTKCLEVQLRLLEGCFKTHHHLWLDKGRLAVSEEQPKTDPSLSRCHVFNGMKQSSVYLPMLTNPAGSGAACCLIPTAHVYCTLRQHSTLTSKLDVPTGTSTLPAPAQPPPPVPAPQTWGMGSHSFFKPHHRCQGLLLFPGLPNRVRVGRMDPPA